MDNVSELMFSGSTSDGIALIHGLMTSIEIAGRCVEAHFEESFECATELYRNGGDRVTAELL